MDQYPGRIRFLTRVEGGRSSPLPSGPRFFATAVAALADGATQPDDWPWTGGQFSIVLELTEAGSFDWTPAIARALVPDGPEAHALHPGAKLIVLDGPRPIAELIIDDGPETEQA